MCRSAGSHHLRYVWLTHDVFPAPFFSLSFYLFYLSEGSAVKNIVRLIPMTLVVVLTLFLWPFLGVSVTAQTGPGCTWDCDPPPTWTNAIQVMSLQDGVCELSMPPACCVVNVSYRYYAGCSGNQIMEITGIRYMNQYCNAHGFNPSKNLRTIVEALLISNPMGFMPNASHPGCLTNTDVSTGQCWYRTGVQTFGYDEWAPCPGTTCCGARYRVCYNADGTRTVMVFQVSNLGSTCPLHGGDSCQESCPWGDWIPTSPAHGDAPHHE